MPDIILRRPWWHTTVCRCSFLEEHHMNWKESGHEPKIRVINSDKRAGLGHTRISRWEWGLRNGAIWYNGVDSNKRSISVSPIQVLVSYCRFLINFGAICVHKCNMCTKVQYVYVSGICVHKCCVHLSLHNTQSKEKTNWMPGFTTHARQQICPQPDNKFKENAAIWVRFLQLSFTGNKVVLKLFSHKHFKHTCKHNKNTHTHTHTMDCHSTNLNITGLYRDSK
jgi:hypothetical protein